MNTDRSPVATHLLIMIVVVVAIVAAGLWAAYVTGHRGFMGLMMVAVAVTVFFGLLAIPGAYEVGGAFGERTIRLAITATLLMEYLVYFGTVIYLDRDEKQLGFDKDLLPTLTTLLAVVVPFYFGASAASEITTRLKGKKQEQSGATT